jgi:hypothetical protein
MTVDTKGFFIYLRIVFLLGSLPQARLLTLLYIFRCVPLRLVKLYLFPFVFRH